MSSEPQTGGAGLPGSARPHARPLDTRDPLERCIAVSADTFATDFWARQPLHSPAATTGADFSDLFSVAAVDELISRRGLRTPFVRMAKQGRVLDASRFTRSGGAGATVADQVADDKVLGLLADGASLVLQGLHRTWPPLVDFGSRLARQLGHPTQINAYVTPADNQGFSAHYDTHDVFVLQIAGRKAWQIHAPVVADPSPEQTWEQRRAEVAERANEQPLLDLTLAPGDAVYLPRGYLHQARALGELSIHLTIGVHPITRHDLLRELVAAVADEPELRRSLPMGADLADVDVLEHELSESIRRLTVTIGDGAPYAGNVATRIGRRLGRDTRPAAIQPLRQLEALADLADDSALQLRPGLRVTATDVTDGLRIEMLDRYLSVPSLMAPAVRLVLGGRPVRVGDLPGLDAAERLVLARRLLREAVVVAVADGLR